MILLDTNVISEAMKSSCNPSVSNWFNCQVAETLYLSSITLAEVWFGINAMPLGRRKDALSGAFKDALRLFGNRVLPFDNEAAHCYALLAAKAKWTGKGFPMPDGYIAAIADAHGFVVATRDTGPFEAAGLAIINPWL